MELTDSNFVLYAAKCYDNPHCNGTEEFLDDLKRFRYVKRLMNQYAEGGELKSRLILNHLIVVYNVFENAGATDMLFYRLRGLERYLKPFLVLMGRMPARVRVGGREVADSDIDMDAGIVEDLRKI